MKLINKLILFIPVIGIFYGFYCITAKNFTMENYPSLFIISGLLQGAMIVPIIFLV